MRRVGTVQALREIAKQGAFRLLGGGPFLARRLAAIEAARPVTILTFHRLGPADGSAWRPMDAGLFERLLAWLQARFAIVSFAGLAAETARPKLVLTFDDGYRDFAEVAMPILARRGVAANLNVIPECVETGLPPLNVLAADFIGKAPAERVRAIVLPGFAAGESDRLRLWQRLDAFIKERPQAEQDELAAILMPQFRAWDGFRPTPMMTLDEVRAAAAAGHEIGAHSFRHASMEHESDAYLADDVARCRDWMRARLGRPLDIYAFPNGSCRAGQAELVEGMGVGHVLLLADGFDTGASPHRRFCFEARTLAEARFKALGRFRPVRP